MKIHEFCQICQCSKKKIHFYINEGLLNPYQHQENGYYEFNDNDVSQMALIQQLRNLDLSIQEIKECIMYPTLTNYFLHRHVHGLKQELEQKLLTLSHLYFYIDQIPPNATPQRIMQCIPPSDSGKTSNLIHSLFPEIDARMIAIILLAPFLRGEVDDYQHFLWDKISTELSNQLGPTLTIYQRLIYQLSAKQIIDTTTTAYNKFNQILSLTDTTVVEETILNYCRQLSEDTHLQELWNTLYTPVLKPTLALYQSPVMHYINKYCPTFQPSMAKLKELLANVASTLINTPLHTKLTTVLQNNFTLTHDNHLDLFMVFYFVDSIYTQLSLKQLKDNRIV